MLTDEMFFLADVMHRQYGTRRLLFKNSAPNETDSVADSSGANDEDMEDLVEEEVWRAMTMVLLVMLGIVIAVLVFRKFRPWCSLEGLLTCLGTMLLCWSGAVNGLDDDDVDVGTHEGGGRVDVQRPVYQERRRQQQGRRHARRRTVWSPSFRPRAFAWRTDLALATDTRARVA